MAAGVAKLVLGVTWDPILGEGKVVGGQRWYHSKEQWWFPIGSLLWPLCYLGPFGRNLPSNVSDAQSNRGWVTLVPNLGRKGLTDVSQILTPSGRDIGLLSYAKEHAIWAQCMKCISFTFTQKTAPTNPSWVTPGKLNQLVDWQAHTHTSISALQPISVDTINILDKAGSRGNSSMLRPSGVSDPVLSSAPRTHSWYMEFIILSFTHNHTSNSHSLYNCST